MGRIFMCMAVDIAKYAISKSIENKNNEADESCYLDFYKLNKLLYLSQCKMLERYNRKLFSDDIYAYRCGPYIRTLEFVFVDWEYNPIDKPYEVIKLPQSEVEIVDEILSIYGKKTRHELGEITKNHPPYVEVFNADSEPSIISTESMSKNPV